MPPSRLLVPRLVLPKLIEGISAPGPVAAGGGGSLTVEYVTSTSSATDASEYTFTGQSIGAEDNARIILVGVVAASGNSINTTVTGLTVGGVAATEQAAGNHNDGAFNNEVSRLFAVALDASKGTTGNVVVTFNVVTRDCAIFIYRFLGSTITADTNYNNSVDPIDMTIDADAGGFCVAVAGRLNDAGAANSFTVTNLTEDADIVPEGNGSAVGAHENFAGAQASLAITLDNSLTGSQHSGCAVVYNP
jgi:hypothetical protein